MSRDNKWSSLIYRRLQWDELDLVVLRKAIELARDEDCAGHGIVTTNPLTGGDATSEALFPREKQVSAQIIAREKLTVCGLHLVPLILAVYHHDFSYQTDYKDGDTVDKGMRICTVTGPVRQLLSAERVLLNYTQFLSGVATRTAEFVQAMGDTNTKLLDTRKTHPGYRALLKYAVTCGGGWNHRLGLHDRIMVKDNHLAFYGSSSGERLTQAILQARKFRPDLPIEVEIDEMEQLEPVLEAEPDIILLDNFSLSDIRKALRRIQQQAWTEASGKIQLDDIPTYAQLGLDFLSTGATVHQSRWVDIGLDWDG